MSAGRCGTTGRLERPAEKGAEGFCGSGSGGMEAGAGGSRLEQVRFSEEGELRGVDLKRDADVSGRLVRGCAEKAEPGYRGRWPWCLRRRRMGDLRNKSGGSKGGWLGATVRRWIRLRRGAIKKRFFRTPYL